MKHILLFLAALCCLSGISLGQAPGVAVTATLTNGQGQPDPTSSLHFQLWNCGNNVPQAIDMATITGLAITSNIMTITAANDYTAGEVATLSGLSVNPQFNGISVRVLASGLSSSQFQVYLTHTNIVAGSETGTASTLGPNAIVQAQFDLRANTSGVITGTIYGNNQISCGGTSTTEWLVTQYKSSSQGVVDPQYYCLNAPGTFNPAVNQPCQINPAPPPYPAGYVPIWSVPYPLGQAVQTLAIDGTFYLPGLSDGCLNVASGVVGSVSDCGGGGGGSPNQAVSFTNQTSVTLTVAGLTPDIVWACYDTGSPPQGVEPAYVTVNQSSYLVTFYFLTPQSGYCVVNSSGGGGSGSVALETNGTSNGSQTVLNLVSGTNITLVNSGGNTTISSAGGGVSGSGSSPFFAVWTGSTSIGNSNLTTVSGPNGLNYSLGGGESIQLDAYDLTFNSGAAGSQNVVIANTFNPGSGNTAGGVAIKGANSTGEACAGNVYLYGGENGSSANNAAITVSGGCANGFGATGSNVTIQGGSTSASNTGGSVILQPGTGGFGNGVVEATGPIQELVGQKYSCSHGTNPVCGFVTLASGTATVATTAIGPGATSSGGDVIALTLQSCTSCGTLYISSITNGTGFVITSSNGSDASNVYWEIHHIY